jgi:hypothetical protein
VIAVVLNQIWTKMNSSFRIQFKLGGDGPPQFNHLTVSRPTRQKQPSDPNEVQNRQIRQAPQPIGDNASSPHGVQSSNEPAGVVITNEGLTHLEGFTHSETLHQPQNIYFEKTKIFLPVISIKKLFQHDL